MSGQHEDSSRASISRVLQEIKLSGKSTSSQLFSGLVPRTAWIGLGGFVFFGFYEVASKFLRDGTDSDEDDSFA
jgi:hypothetical protein